jgi:sulfate adenylyltransferase subunit 1 (EFTu-like GTPase family)
MRTSRRCCACARAGGREQDGPDRLRRALSRHRARLQPRCWTRLRPIPAIRSSAIFVPVSALKGDNIVHAGTDAMPWYTGPSLLELLEQLAVVADTRTAPFRFPVQRVLGPTTPFADLPDRSRRAPFAGRRSPCCLQAEARGRAHCDLGRRPRRGHAPLSVTLVLDRELDISRGDLIASAERRDAQ